MGAGTALGAIAVLWIVVHMAAHALIAAHLRRTAVTVSIALRVSDGAFGGAKGPLPAALASSITSALAPACAPQQAKRTKLKPLILRHIAVDHTPPPGASWLSRLGRALASEWAWNVRAIRHFAIVLCRALGLKPSGAFHDELSALVISRAQLPPSLPLTAFGGGDSFDAVLLTTFSWRFGIAGRDAAAQFRARLRDESTLSALEAALTAALGGAECLGGGESVRGCGIAYETQQRGKSKSHAVAERLNLILSLLQDRAQSAPSSEVSWPKDANVRHEAVMEAV